jgi:hypothetical protein
MTDPGTTQPAPRRFAPYPATRTSKASLFCKHFRAPPDEAE